MSVCKYVYLCSILERYEGCHVVSQTLDLDLNLKVASMKAKGTGPRFSARAESALGC